MSLDKSKKRSRTQLILKGSSMVEKSFEGQGKKMTKKRSENLVILIWNSKGGVGKSSISAQLALTMSANGKNILLIDSDPQSSLSQLNVIGINPQTELTLTKVLMKEIQISDAIKATAIPNVSIVPGALSLFRLNSSVMISEVSKILKPIRTNFDYILIDAPSTYNSLVAATIHSADTVVIPTAFSEVDLGELDFVINEIEDINPSCEKIIVPTKTTYPDKLSKEEIEYFSKYSPIMDKFLSKANIIQTHLVKRIIDRGVILDAPNKKIASQLIPSLQILAKQITGENYPLDFIK